MGWSYFFDGPTSIMTITGDMDFPDFYLIDITFDPSLVVLGRGSINYNRSTSSGTLDNVDILNVVPLPPAVLLGSLGLTFSGWLLHKRKML